MSVLYPYRCSKCGAGFDIRAPMGDYPEETECPECGGFAVRHFVPLTVHFKARGFTGAGRKGDGRVDVFRHKDGSPLEESVRESHAARELDVER